METAKASNSKNGMDEQKDIEDFLKEDKIQEKLKGKIEKNKERFAGKTIFVGAGKRTLPDPADKSKDEGDPLSWIEPDHDISHHADTKHGQERHAFTYRHLEPLGKYNCNTLTDKWYEWHLKTPASISAFTNPSQSYEDESLLGGRNAFLFQDNDVSVYFAAAAPFQQPDIRTITMIKQAPLLVPVYNMSASTQDHPSKKTDQELTELIIEDLSGVIELNASFDRNPIEGCCVIRQKRLPVTNVPTDNVIGIPEDRMLESGNSIQTCHGGYWLLIREKVLTPGDHLLDFSAISKNYELNVKILINVLV
jgi:hypothetical protein